MVYLLLCSWPTHAAGKLRSSCSSYVFQTWRNKAKILFSTIKHREWRKLSHWASFWEVGKLDARSPMDSTNERVKEAGCTYIFVRLYFSAENLEIHIPNARSISSLSVRRLPCRLESFWGVISSKLVMIFSFHVSQKKTGNLPVGKKKRRFSNWGHSLKWFLRHFGTGVLPLHKVRPWESVYQKVSC